MSDIDTPSRPAKVIAEPSQLRAWGRQAFALFSYYAHNPFVWREDQCACGNWDEGFLQAQYAAEWARRHRS